LIENQLNTFEPPATLCFKFGVYCVLQNSRQAKEDSLL